MRVPLPTRRKTIQLARRLAPLLAAGDLLILEGDLGAGKTFFTRALSRALGVPSGVRVTSPTFTLVHDLGGTVPIIHADLYRLGGSSELGPLGLEELRAQGSIVVVEWGKPYLLALGGDAVVMQLTLGPEGRTADVEGSGPRSAALVERLEASLREGGSILRVAAPVEQG